MIDCLELNVDSETVERNLGKYFYNLKKGKASNHWGYFCINKMKTQNTDYWQSVYITG